MQYSRHNIASPVKGSGHHFIINLLSGQADIVPDDEMEAFFSGSGNLQQFREKGYLADPEGEKEVFKEAYLDFLDKRDSSEVQLFLVPWYSCNFSCVYCYQERYEQQETLISADTIDAFFSYIDNEFKYQKKYITLFGGEPLLPGGPYRERIERIAAAAAARNLDIAVVTNGYHLSGYLDILSKGGIREIQVTLDGTESIHDSRRPLKSGGGTFKTVAGAVTETLGRGIPVNLRVVADLENIPGLHELADYAEKNGWTGNSYFKTQMGRNYELHTCQVNRQVLLSRIDFAKTLFAEFEKHPSLMNFYKPSFSVAKHLKEQGKLPQPLFDSCPGCKTEWAFDLSGRIYSCTATVGKEGEAVGRFYPDIMKNESAIGEWAGRDILSIPECADCEVSLACGGGCAAVAKHNHGRLNAPDCRPVKELLELGIPFYFNEDLT